MKSHRHRDEKCAEQVHDVIKEAESLAVRLDGTVAELVEMLSAYNAKAATPRDDKK